MDVVEMNISASLMIAFTMLLRDTALKRLPNIMFCTLWFVILLRLLVPLSITSEVSIFNLYYFLKDNMFYKNSIFGTVLDTTQLTSVKTMIIQPETQMVISSTKLLYGIWLIGIIVSVLLRVYSYIGNFMVTRNTITLNENSFAVKWLNQQKGFRKVSVKLSWSMITPVSVGIFSPTIILPYQCEEEKEERIKHLLCHECMHIKYHHILWRILIQMVICINWFNPLLYVMEKYIVRDMEIFCDYRTMEFLKPEPKEYAETIIIEAVKEKQAEKNGKRKKGLFLYSGFSKGAIKERVALLGRWKKVSALTAVTSCLIVLGATTVFATTSNVIVEDKKSNMVSGRNISNGEVSREDSIVDNIVDRTEKVTLTESDVEIENAEERAARYLVVYNYKYVEYGSLPKALDASIEQDGYLYEGILYLDDYVYESATDKYTGYYSGKLYR